MKTALLIALSAAGLLSVARADDKVVKSEKLPLPRLFVNKEDEKLLEKLPKGAVIAGPKAWAEFWKTWGGDKDAPKVDFDKELVLIASGPGPNIIKVSELKLSDKGNLSFGWSITERGGPGITVVLLKVSREGVKSVNGTELTKE
jgi:hypothetical protein